MILRPKNSIVYRPRTKLVPYVRSLPFLCWAEYIVQARVRTCSVRTNTRDTLRVNPAHIEASRLCFMPVVPVIVHR